MAETAEPTSAPASLKDLTMGPWLVLPTLVLLGGFAALERADVTLRGALHPLFQLVLIGLLAMLSVHLVLRGRWWALLALMPLKFVVLVNAPKLDPWENGLPNWLVFLLLLAMELSVIVALLAFGHDSGERRIGRWSMWLSAVLMVFLIVLVGAVSLLVAPRQANVVERADNTEIWNIDYGGAYGCPRGGIQDNVRVNISYPSPLLEQRQRVDC